MTWEQQFQMGVNGWVCARCGAEMVQAGEDGPIQMNHTCEAPQTISGTQ